MFVRPSLLLLVVLCTNARADEIPVPGGRFDDGASRGADFEHEEWTVKGSAVLRRVGEGDYAVEIGPAARLGCTVSVGELEPFGRLTEVPDVKRWTAILSVDAGLAGAAGAKSKGTLRVTFEGGGKRYSERLAVDREGLSQRLIISLPASALSAGSWDLEIVVLGRTAVMIDDVALHRVPTHVDEMRFAKPNGVDGPDRIASGALGFAAWTAHDHGPLPVVDVIADSPAARAGMKATDVVLAVDGVPLPRSSCRPGWSWFRDGHEAVLGRAVEDAMVQGRRHVELEVLRGEERRTLKIEFVKRPALPEDFPFDETATPRLWDDLTDFVLRTRRTKQRRWANGGNEWIQTSFAGLALLGRRDESHADIIHETADWFLARFPEPEAFGNLGFWSAAYAGIFLAEYHFATGDDRVLPWLEEALRWIARGFHTSKWDMPALGHGPSGLPYDNKALMAPATHVFVLEALAKRLGLKSEIFETLWPYTLHSWSDPAKQGHGAMGYNGSYRDKNEFWSRTGLFVLACRLRGERRTKVMEEACVEIMARRHPWMRNSHAYGNPGDVWGLVGLHLGNRGHFEDVMAEWRWAVGGAWQPGYGLRHSMAHMGSPYMGGEGLVNPAWAMLLSVRTRGLMMTGAPPNDAGWLGRRKSEALDARVVVERDGEGRVVLKAPARAGIRYTTDGSEPSRRSTRYDGPFLLPEGGLVRASVEVSRKAMGPVTRRALGLSKDAWRVISANGAGSEAEAIERASRLIDDDPRSPWQPDRGAGMKSFPFEVTIDLGERRLFSGLAFTGDHRPRKIVASFADELRDLSQDGREYLLDEKGVARLEEVVGARFLRVAITDVRDGVKTRFGELDLAHPNISVARQGKSIELGAELGVVLRYSLTGKIPTDSSRKASGKIRVPAGKPLFVRRFTAEGHAIGPVVVIPVSGE